MTKWSRAVDALCWWYDHLDAARTYGQGCIPPPEDDEMVDQSIDNWDYPDWWYTWLDLDIIFTRRFTEQEQVIMSYYLVYVFGGDAGTFYRWKQKDKFNDLMRKLWSLLPDTYRTYDTRLRHARPKKGETDVAGIDPGKYYSVQEIAETLRFSKDAVLYWIKVHGLKALKSPGKTGFQYRIHGQDLIDFLTNDGGEDEDKG